MEEDDRMGGCRLPGCLTQFSLYAGAEGASYADGGYDWQHCERPDCHELYWRGKNGADCAECGLKMCEDCQCGWAAENSEGEYVCPGC